MTNQFKKEKPEWKASAYLPIADLYKLPQGGHIIEQKDGTIIAFIPESLSVDGAIEDIARQMAAAPVMLKALEMALDVLDTHNMGQYGTAPFIRSAIDKAKPERA